MDLREIRAKARELAKGSCRVCPACDGRACSGEVPGMGGAITGSSFRANVAALAAIKLNSRLVHKVSFPKLETEILGLSLRLPVLVAPIGGVGFNLGGAMPEPDYQEAIAFGASDAGIVAGTPDAVPIEPMKAGLAQAEQLGGKAIPFIKPWEPDQIEERLQLCLAAGCKVVACDLDSVGLVTLRIMGKPAYPKDQEELASIMASVHEKGAKIVIKGIMTVSDAVKCADAGADGLVVSNHGGRVLDSVPGTAEVLPAIAAAVSDKCVVTVDGGVRSGVDVLKMLALGAKAVWIGRPFAIAAIGGGRAGVALYAESIRAQLEQAMIMTGCPDAASAQKSGILYAN